ncbi:quinon protein alcohol dehydrogenase-like superfamily [Thamnocephalis sphaerospora]|uniref:Quinon protein alcohol dehydrogenase-like superfamily n=1 Tax=Thamnocephalis sphaerospora TaxID=78915 RepID=A0A4P9XHX4_9FUNG|nr:quinon protein alcohol dehydrogenase-like superfamily [Thamnocephalis sphaerospora]|eukprot:RKP04901.1 quinon protein alcohol dehydrogenase-like superfamily [Thamnocephalis sphaerospora]
MVANAKKRRTQRKKQRAAKSAGASLYQPFRAIGYVTRDIPFSLQARGQAHFMTTALDQSFQVYDVCTRLPADLISCVAAQGDSTFVACGADIVIFERVSEAKRLRGPQGTAVLEILPFGDLLVSRSDDNVVRVWSIRESKMSMELRFDPQDFALSCMMHPSTYLNKLLFASKQGGMQLWNIATGKLVYKFGELPAPITCLVQSPVVDVVAIGLDDATVLLHNTRLDEPVLSVKQNGRVTSISFRTDEQQMMATGNSTGDIAFWDLEHRRLIHTLANVHDGRVHLQFLNGQPLLVSTGINSIKQWIFDGAEDSPRLLRSRGGHSLPPTMIRMYDADGNFILSAGGDRSLRIFSTRRDRQNTELSQGSLAKNAQRLDVRVDELRLPPIVTFDACELKEKHWDNIVTGHAGSSEACTWSFQRKAIGQHRLQSRDGSPLKTVTLSACGNYALLGLASGRVEMFNLQSGIFRREFTGDQVHTKPVTGIATDATNHTVFTVSLDGRIKFWSFGTGKLQHTIDLDTPITAARLNRENDLLAVVADDLCIRVVDTQTRRLVREFHGHTNMITDFAFSPDGRWIVSASLDGTVRTWDLATGYLVDWFATEQVCTSVTFSPDGAFLATAHVDNLGVFLWANRAHYMNVPLRRVPTSEPCWRSATTSHTSARFAEAPSLEEASTVVGSSYTTPDQLVAEMVTLSSVPQSVWQRLLHLDTIKKRNKPKQPIKAPEKAPFFLQTQVDETGTRFVKADNLANDESKMLSLNELRPSTTLGAHLQQAHTGRNYAAVIEYMLELNPSAADFAIRSLSPFDDCLELCCFLEAIRDGMRAKRAFDALEAYLNLFLKIHGDLVIGSERLAMLVREIKQHQETEWRQIEDLFQNALCLVDYGRNTYA